MNKLLRAFALVLAALSGVTHAQPVSTEKVKIVLGSLPLAPTWGVTVVTQAGLWKKYLPNVEVERVEAMSGMPLVNNIVAGKVDIAYLGDTPAIILGSKRDVALSKFVAVTEADDGITAVAYVKTDSPITSLKQLDGKRISISFGAYTHRFAEMLAAREGIKPTYVGQSPEVGLTSLQTGKVDAYITWSPYGPMAVHRGAGKKLADGRPFKFQSVRCIVVSKQFAEKHPDILVGWLRAELDAHRLLRERPVHAAKLIHADWRRFDIPLEAINEEIRYKTFPDDLSQPLRKTFQESAEFLLTHDLIKQLPDFNNFVDDSYLKKAAAIPSQLDLAGIKE